MPAIRKKPAAKAKTTKKKPSAKIRERTTPRVEETPPEMHNASGGLSKKQAPPVHDMHGTMKIIGPNEVLISAVLAETVRVAQYANVVIGPVGASWVLGGVDMSILSDVDWDADEPYDEMTKEQKLVYDKMYGSMRATMRITEAIIAEDRETVERSIRSYNEREKAEEAAKPKKRRSSR